MGFPREGRYHERVVRTENYMINAGDDVMGGYCRKHALFLSGKLLAKEGHRRGIGSEKGAKKGIKFVGWRRLALFVWGNN